MAAHPYSLRSRLNAQSPSIRTTPVASPFSRTGARSPRKTQSSHVSLQLQHVIGTTTNSPTGLACCAATDTYAHCAGAVAALTTVHENGSYSQRYFRARPTASSLNPSTSYYETNSPSTTPSRRRSSIFPAGRGREDTQNGGLGFDESGGQTWTARERIKAASCVSLSSDGKWLAVGESGYNPRVLLFSTADDAPTDIPVSIASDHTFGVRSVAFSPDSRYLATLGNLNDGFLFIWSLHPRTGSLRLHSANKCTTHICDMAWCGNSLITAGTRHVKVWQVGETTKMSPTKRFKFRSGSEEVASPGPTALQGRNCLLGSLVDSTFTCIAPLKGGVVAIGSETGHLCTLDVSQGALELRTVKLYDFGITSMTLNPATGDLVLGGRRGLCYEDTTSLQRLLQPEQSSLVNGLSSPRRGPRLSSIRQSLGIQQPGDPGIVAVGSLSQILVVLDSNGDIILEHASDGPSDIPTTFASHNNLIQGVQALPSQSPHGTFFTWSKNGEVKFWGAEGGLLGRKFVNLEEAESGDDNGQNELRVVRYMPKLQKFVTGDRFGVLRLINDGDWQGSYVGRAHSAEITGMALDEESSFLATCSRDRTVQLFASRNGELDLVQTMDEHIGAVTQVTFTHDAQRLLSCSTDRTIVVRERLQRQSEERQETAYLTSRVVTLRATPLSMTFADGGAGSLLVSTMDRYIVKVDSSCGTIVDTCKITDPDNDDTVALNSLCASRKGTSVEDTTNLMVGYSAIDKSIRVYDVDKNLLLTRESGHTEGISDLCLIEQRSSDCSATKRTVISTGLDGTIMMWNISLSSPSLLAPFQELSQRLLAGSDSEGTPLKASPASLPPLRKVLTKMDVLEFTKSSAPASSSSPRSLSPARLTRKKSQLALTSTIDEKDEEDHTAAIAASKVQDTPARGRTSNEKSPSPQSVQFARPKKQRSRSEVGSDSDTRKNGVTRSPSPPATPSTSMTPNRRQQPNVNRLRRPPSVPTDLRGQAVAHGRRQSMGQTSDFGSMGMATEQACRMLRTYRKKLLGSKDEVVLDELEDELENMMRVVRDRKEKRMASGATRRLQARAATENDIDELAVLLDRTNMADRSPKALKVEK